MRLKARQNRPVEWRALRHLDRDCDWGLGGGCLLALLRTRLEVLSPHSIGRRVTDHSSVSERGTRQPTVVGWNVRHSASVGTDNSAHSRLGRRLLQRRVSTRKKSQAIVR